jgi:AcrR family transcriptional regulator
MKQVFKEMAMTGSETKNAPSLTKEAREAQKRLLDAAEELFAQKGLDGTSIRDLTAKANCNLASINYYFGDKQELYEELFRQRLREMRNTRLAGIKAVMTDKSRPMLEDLLRAYAVAFLEPFADPGRSERFTQLLAREIVEQRLPKSMFLEEMGVPLMAALEDALAVICPQLDKHSAQMSTHSIVGQMIHIVHLKVMLGDQAAQTIAAINLDEAIDHIVKFSAAGIRACIKGNR